MRSFVRRAGVYVWHTRVCAAVLVVAVSVFWAGAYSLSVHSRRQAERMLQQLAAVQPGAASSITSQEIIESSGGRKHSTADLCSYDFDDSFMFADSGLKRVFWRTEWDYFGLRPWRVTGFILRRNKGLSDVEVVASVGQGRGWLVNDGFFSGNMWATRVVFVETDAGKVDHAFGKEKEEILRYGNRTENQIEATSDGIAVNTPHLTTPGGGRSTRGVSITEGVARYQQGCVRS
jgi:hypothetical protein